jgi:type IV secretory pathway TrbF-like protein
MDLRLVCLYHRGLELVAQATITRRAMETPRPTTHRLTRMAVQTAHGTILVTTMAWRMVPTRGLTVARAMFRRACWENDGSIVILQVI